MARLCWFVALLLVLIVPAPASAQPDPKLPKPQLDHHGDPLPPFAVARLGTARLRHAGPVTGVAYAPDGKTLFSTGHDGHVRLWHPVTGQALRSIQPSGVPLRTVAITGDGRLMAVAAENKFFYLIDADKGQLLAHLPAPAPLTNLHFSPDGKTLAGVDVDRNLSVWDVADKKPAGFAKPLADVRAAAFAADGKTLLAVRGDHTLHAYDLATGKPQAPKAGAALAVRGAAFSGDGRVLACQGKDGTVRVRDTATGKELWKLAHPADEDMALAFAPDGKTLAAGDGFGPLRLWSLATGKEVAALPPAGAWLFGLAFAPDGKTLATAARNAVRLWDPHTGKAASTPDGGHDPVTAVAVAPDGQTIAVLREAGLTLWDAAKRQPRLVLVKSGADLACVAYGPRGDVVAAGGWDGAVRVWDAKTGKLLRTLEGHEKEVVCLAFATDGALASGGRDGLVRLWPAVGDKPLRTWTDFKERPHSLSFSPDGKHLAVATGTPATEPEFHLYDVVTGAARHSEEASGHLVAFAPDGRLVAVAGGQWPEKPTAVRAHELATGEKLVFKDAPFKRPLLVTALAFGPDGRTVASAQAGGLLVQDLFSPQSPGLLAEGQVTVLAWSADGRTLVTAGPDTTVLLWDGAALCAARRTPAKLTDNERQAAWDELANTPPAPAYQAVARLADDPGVAAWLKARLQPVPPVDAKLAAKWLENLEDKNFGVRQQATAALEKAGPALVPLLRTHLKKDLAVESKRRVEQILEKLEPDGPGKAHRVVRAVAVLELAAAPDAVKLLQALAGGAPEAPLTAEARAALKRLQARSLAPAP